MEFLRSLKKNKELIWFLAGKDDIKSAICVVSSLGVLWAYAQPCVTIIIITGLCSRLVLRSVAPGQYANMPFLVWIMCGLIPWFSFSDGINSVTSVFLEYSYLVKKVALTLKFYLVIKIISATSCSFVFYFVTIYSNGFIWIYA
ncbi:MAG: hypothetical protein ACLTTH_16430 [Holdemanella porci]